MYIEKHIPNKQKGEKLILFLRRHPIVLVGHFLFYSLILVLPIIVFYIINQNNPELIYNDIIFPFLLLLGSLYYLFAWLFFYHAFIDYYLDVWIVTNKRIINIEQKGLFNRLIAEHSIDKIQDVAGQQKGIFQTFLSYGTVNIQTAGEVQLFIFKQVNDPFEVIKTINHLLKDLEDKKEARLQRQPPPQETSSKNQ